MKHAVIYVPGLGDHRYKGQQLLIATWRLWGFTPRMVRMQWHDGVAFTPKLERLLDAIDRLNERGYRVSLVGASAGAGAVINAYALRKDIVRGVICIAGKVHNGGGMSENYRRRNPAFVESAELAEHSVASLDRRDRQRILSRYARWDPIVPRADSVITGAENQQLRTRGHELTIATQLAFGARSFLAFLRRQS